ncbi:hypothetical protein Q5P01_006205 [Channa striata]|uniref:Uncharacterized protein n=1 Tax=Channa striata TaxID=64152 RepID=A0AA88NB10_CHASR|nr:hypothetical protein Q5P01_006205 [Channa striata]
MSQLHFTAEERMGTISKEPLLSLAETPGTHKGPQANTLCQGFSGILAFESRTGSPALWQCQEGVRADLCYTLPSITEQITLLGDSPSCPTPPSPLSYWEVFHEQLGPGRGERGSCLRWKGHVNSA